MDRAPGENEIQQAILGSLDAYFRDLERQSGVRRDVRLFPPFANQQGDGPRRYCADIVGVLDNAAVMLLEVKVLECASRELQAFDELQFEKNVLLHRELRIPVAYVYNDVTPLPYYFQSRPTNWPADTLNHIRWSSPPELPNKHPYVDSHITLLKWLDDASRYGGDKADIIGRILGTVTQASTLSNAVVALIYGVDNRQLFQLQGPEMVKVLRILRSRDGFGPKNIKKLTQLLDGTKYAEAMVEKWRKTPGTVFSPRKGGDFDPTKSPRRRFP